MAAAKIALVGDYDPSVTAHVAIPKALELSHAPLDWQWVGTDTIEGADDLASFDAIWCVPASPYTNEQGAIAAIRHAREASKPFLGTCGGYQHAVLEYARHVLNRPKAGNTEVDPDCQMPVISGLTCALRDVTDPVQLSKGSRMAAIYGATEAEEGYFCGYGVNAAYLSMFDGTPLSFTAFDGAGDPRGFELANHPFFMGTAYQPERTALEGRPHPLIIEFAKSAAARVAQAA